MATELAKAYVQIVPSAQGISGSISNVLDPEAKSAGDKAGATVGGNIVSGIKKLVVAAGIGTIIKDAISEGADFEQNVGGIETLFGEGAQTMLDNAANAYKTAGLSANEYMETVTGFAASLKQSVGGDMEALTTSANTAVIDMADNANKMGTSMESIQNAYAGFAKGQFQLLDNLKLGYGGTKTEAERLLKDASKISGVKYDINNLADVYDAIHVIQTDLGITGTTAKEASETFSGSFAAMKSSASNLLAQLSTGGDVGGALSGLIESFNTFLWNNALPMIGNIVSSIPDILSTLMQGLTEEISKIAENSDGLVSFALNFITNLATALITGLPSLVSAVWDLAVGIGEALVNFDWSSIMAGFGDSFNLSMNPEMIKQGGEVVTNLLNGILEGLPSLMSGAGEMLNTLYESYLTEAPKMLEAGVETLLNLVDGIMQNLPEIVASATEIISKLLITLAEHLPDLIQMGIKLIGELTVGILKAIPQIIKAILSLIKTIIETFKTVDWASIGKNLIDGVVNGLKEAGSKIWETLKEICAEVFQSVKDFFKIGSPSKLMANEVGRWIPAGIAQGIAANTAPLTDEMQTLANETVGTINGALVGDLRTNPNITAAQTSTDTNKKTDVYAILEEYLPRITEYVSEQISVNDRELLRRVSRQNQINYRARNVDVLNPAY